MEETVVLFNVLADEWRVMSDEKRVREWWCSFKAHARTDARRVLEHDEYIFVHIGHQR